MEESGESEDHLIHSSLLKMDATKENTDAKPRSVFKRFIIRDSTDTVDFGVLPEGWIQLRHVSGINIYFHRPSRVVTVSRPYNIGNGSVKHHRLPVCAIPCLAHRRNNINIARENTEGEKLTNGTDASGQEILHHQCLPIPVVPSNSMDDQPEINEPLNEVCSQPDNSDTMRELDELDGISQSSYKPSEDREEGELSSVEDDVEFDEICDDDKPSTASKSRELEVSVDKGISAVTPPKKSTVLVTATGSPANEVAQPSAGNVASIDPGPVASAAVCKTTFLGRRNRWRRFEVANPRHSVGEAGQLTGDCQVELPTGAANRVKCQVLSVNYKDSRSHLLSNEDIRTYCSRLFEVTVEETPLKRKHIENDRIDDPADPISEQLPLLMLPESAKVIRYQVSNSSAGAGRKAHQHQSQEGMINMTGKSYVCILHEYCQNVIRRPPTYQTETLLDNAQTPYQVKVVIDGVPYPTGLGQSKRQARLEAARKALECLIPDFEKVANSEGCQTGIGQQATAAGQPQAISERDLEMFNSVSLTDPRLHELSTRMALPSPYSLLIECLNRSCVPESELKSNMTSHGRNKHFFTLELQDHYVKVPCRNKREGRHLAAQHLLARLHPEITCWTGLLRMYGPGSKPDKRGDPEALQDNQSQQKSSSSTSSVKTNLIRLLRSKMLELADQLEKNGTIGLKGKFAVPPDHLPVVAFHVDSKSDLYNSMPVSPGAPADQQASSPGGSTAVRG